MRYIRRGTSRVYWLSVEPADLAAPTAGELAAGDDITGEVESDG